MVGARNGSAVGQKLTRQLATELGLKGPGFRDRSNCASSLAMARR